MLILIGTVPTSYALNRALPQNHVASFSKASVAASKVVEAKAAGYNVLGDPRPAVTNYISRHEFNEGTYPSLAKLIREIARVSRPTDRFRRFPSPWSATPVTIFIWRQRPYAFSPRTKRAELSDGEKKILTDYKGQIDQATKFIPTWVKVAVAIALGLGTMIGWKRIVVTVGEKIGKQHLTYGQGAAAELVAMGTIGAADAFGLPVSTTHVLSSGVAGTMAANGSGVQMATIRSLLTAWVLTLPCAILLSGALYFLLRQVM